jgi:hypothetical protein
MSDDRELDTLLRSTLAPADLPSPRVAAIRARARDELRLATGRPDRRRQLRRALEAAAVFALGALQVTWAVLEYLGRPPH